MRSTSRTGALILGNKFLFSILRISRDEGRQCEPFGFVMNYKFVTNNPTNFPADIDKEQWCNENKMKINENKRYLSPIREKNNCNLGLNGTQLEYKNLTESFRSSNINHIFSLET